MLFSIFSTQASATGQDSNSQRTRRKSDPRQGVARGKRVSKPFLALLGVLILIGGMLLGVFLDRQRHRTPEVVVAVNGVVIDKGRFYDRLESAAGDLTIHQLVGDELQLQFARQKGVAPTDAEVAAKFAEAVKQPNFEQQLLRSHQTPALYKRSLQVGLAKTALLTQGIKVTEPEIRKYYAAQSDHKNPTARYYSPDAIRIAVIITAQEAQAQQALKALHDGVPFADVAQKYSQDQSKANGGVMPAFARGRTRSSRIPGFEEAVFALKIGQLLGPQRFANAWWIVQCLDKSAAQTVPYDKVREDCRTGALVAKGALVHGKQLAAEFDDFQRHATIQAFWQKYADAVSNKQ